MIGLGHIVAALRELVRARPEVDHVIRVARGDRRFDWSALRDASDGGLPGLDVGQHADYRFRTEQNDGLHVHVFADRVELHLDRADPLRDVIAHILTDTAAAEGALKGAGLGLLVSLLTDDPKYIAVGAALGAAAGATSPARSPQITHLADLLPGR